MDFSYMLVNYRYEIQALAFDAAVPSVSFVPQNQIILHLFYWQKPSRVENELGTYSLYMSKKSFCSRDEKQN
jgi:hypothetical protein